MALTGNYGRGDYQHGSIPARYQVIDLESAAQSGHMDVSTLKWWMPQTPEARAVFFNEGACQLDEALLGFTEWFGEPKPIWGDRADFDACFAGREQGITLRL